ncbi:28S ribosomal protein S29, mitochondrial [Anopheles moucheti]|uniref:28S ribosomal protein S29, mitochondrial n=1 Tax=Anopheles moucheti TaxID=186751 RepID=UPI0022F0AC01|nr:28S ribosomal protein S29, mitochondrial [Anopheles moucheti]XP_052900693.1 28S ribosomal protein S29, mitochondrial [Anopheles moucheti]
MIRNMVPLMQARFFYSTITASATATLANKVKPKLEEFRTTEQIVAEHQRTTIGRFYTIQADVRKKIFGHGGLPKSFEKQIKTFNECSLMVRLPAVEIIEYIKRTDFNRPVNRFVLYGEDGAGKSLTLAHLLHYGFQQKYILIHVPWVPNWMKRAKEIANSTTKEGAIDLPLDGAAWLVHFKSQNGSLLKDLGLKVSRDYVWTKREITPAGAPLMDLIEHGINRAKFSCDAIAALLHELKEHSNAGRARAMVLIDGFNAFFQPHTRLLTENKVRVKPEQLTLTDPFLSITRNDWRNGVCVVTIDQMVAEFKDKSQSQLNGSDTANVSAQPPLSVIDSRQCFEHLDPFVPVRVVGYDDAEYYSCIQYYLERKWIQTTELGFDDELKMLSCQNPYQLMQLCASL